MVKLILLLLRSFLGFVILHRILGCFIVRIFLQRLRLQVIVTVLKIWLLLVRNRLVGGLCLHG